MQQLNRVNQVNSTTEFKYKTFTKEDLLQIFPFGRSKLNDLLQANVLPVIKIGRHYLTSEKLLDEWFSKYKGKEIRY